MARFTSAYSSFVRRLDEVEALRRLALEKERDDPIRHSDQINALCRGAVVLLSSHLEAYVKELGELALESLFIKGVSRSDISSQFFYHISKGYINEIKDTSDPSKIADKVFLFVQNDLDYWSRTGPFPRPIDLELFNKGFSNPAYNKIKKYYNRFGYSDYSADLAQVLLAQFHPVINMVDHLVHTRNAIAHGDPAASKTPSEVIDMISLVRLFSSRTDSVFGTWWKANFCSIR
jgi:hypothetical protein